MKKTARQFVPLLWLSLPSIPVLAQQASQPDTLPLNELKPVTVTAYRMETSDLATPLSITTIGERQLQNGTQQLGLDEALGSIPGLFVQNGTNFAQDIRVSIRGFGARSAFGIRGVKVMVDGFPESTPDGTSQVDAVDAGSLTGLSVTRSGSGGLYGNASGGVINFSTLKFTDEEWGEVGSTFGSYGFYKNQARFGGGKANKFLYSVNGAITGTDGYREHSAVRNNLVNGGFLLPIDSSFTIKGVITYVNSPYAQDPGALTIEQSEEDRKQAAYSSTQYKIDEKLWQLRVGIGLTKHFSANHSLSANFFQTNRGFNNRLRNNIVELDRSFTGGVFRYEFKTKPRPINWHLSLGVDLEKQTDDRKRFANDNGEKAEQFAYQTETFSSVGYYAVQKLALGKVFTFFASLRYDDINFAVDDKFLEDNMDSDYSQGYHPLNPTFGLSIMLSPTIFIVANHGRNFETPTLLELGQSANNSLQPQKSRTTEIGYKILSANGKFRIEPSFYIIRLENEIVGDDRTRGPISYENIGSSDRLGMELACAAQFSRHFYGSLNYTFSSFKFDEFYQYNDKAMPGIPKHKLDMMLGYSNPDGFSVALGTNYIGQLYTYFDNETTVKPYWYGYIRSSYAFDFKSVQVALFGGVNNLYNKWYNSNIRLGYYDVYEPAPLRNFYAGLKIRI